MPSVYVCVRTYTYTKTSAQQQDAHPWHPQTRATTEETGLSREAMQPLVRATRVQANHMPVCEDCGALSTIQ